MQIKPVYYWCRVCLVCVTRCHLLTHLKGGGRKKNSEAIKPHLLLCFLGGGDGGGLLIVFNIALKCDVSDLQIENKNQDVKEEEGGKKRPTNI